MEDPTSLLHSLPSAIQWLGRTLQQDTVQCPRPPVPRSRLGSPYRSMSVSLLHHPSSNHPSFPGKSSVWSRVNLTNRSSPRWKSTSACHSSKTQETDQSSEENSA